MGYYKNLLTKAEAGNKEAMLKIGNDYILKDDLPNAIRWLEKAGDSSKAEKLRKKLAEKQNV